MFKKYQRSWSPLSGVKVQFSPVQNIFYLNPELDFGFGSMPQPELWTGPSVQVQRRSGSGSEGDELRTGPSNLVNKSESCYYY
jgi:hypothetical protein